MRRALAFMLCAASAASVLSLPMDAADLQADPAMIMYSAVPGDVSKIGLKTINLKTVDVENVGLRSIHSPFLWRKKRDVADHEMDQQADPAMIMYSTLPVMSRIHSPFFWRKKRDVSAAEMDQQADPAMIMYSTLPVMSRIHSPFFWRKKRDVSAAEMDQQADPAMIMYSALGDTTKLKTIPVSSVKVNNVALRNIHSPFLWRKKRDVAAAEMDQQADPATVIYSALPITYSNINRPFHWLKKRDTADQTAEEARILYTMPLMSNMFGRRTIMLLKK